jgi:WD40 repeat protein
MVAAIRRGRSLRAVARQFGVGIATVSHWVERAKGQRLASTSYGGFLAVWDARTDPEALTLRGREPVQAVCFHPDGKRAASTAFRFVRIWDLRTGQAVRTLTASSGGGQRRRLQPRRCPPGHRGRRRRAEGVGDGLGP